MKEIVLVGHILDISGSYNVIYPPQMLVFGCKFLFDSHDGGLVR